MFVRQTACFISWSSNLYFLLGVAYGLITRAGEQGCVDARTSCNQYGSIFKIYSSTVAHEPWPQTIQEDEAYDYDAPDFQTPFGKSLSMKLSGFRPWPQTLSRWQSRWRTDLCLTEVSAVFNFPKECSSNRTFSTKSCVFRLWVIGKLQLEGPWQIPRFKTSQAPNKYTRAKQ